MALAGYRKPVFRIAKLASHATAWKRWLRMSDILIQNLREAKQGDCLCWFSLKAQAGGTCRADIVGETAGDSGADGMARCRGAHQKRGAGRTEGWRGCRPILGRAGLALHHGRTLFIVGRIAVNNAAARLESGAQPQAGRRAGCFLKRHE